MAVPEGLVQIKEVFKFLRHISVLPFIVDRLFNSDSGGRLRSINYSIVHGALERHPNAPLADFLHGQAYNPFHEQANNSEARTGYLGFGRENVDPVGYEYDWRFKECRHQGS